MAGVAVAPAGDGEGAMEQIKEATVTTNGRFDMMRQAAHKQRKSDLTDRPLVALDPGETTGMAFCLPWQSHSSRHIIHLKQIPTKTVVDGYNAIRQYWPETRVKGTLIVEDYKVYSWKTEDHAWAGLHTAQLIGAIKILAFQLGWDIHFRMAGDAKSFCTDELLKQWGIYEPGMKHARDAERHLVKTIFFGH